MGRFSGVVSGSPPRARGRLSVGSPDSQRRRFTPACAGTARRWRWSSQGRTVHPRVRGDGPWANPYTWWASVHPRVRGDGICHFSPRSWVSVHPRVRGDGIVDTFKPAVPFGSPPRARGRRSPRRTPGGSRRFTPRARGRPVRVEQVRVVLRFTPRARGRRCDRRVVGKAVRFTPACAGTAVSASPTSSC